MIKFAWALLFEGKFSNTVATNGFLDRRPKDAGVFDDSVLWLGVVAVKLHWSSILDAAPGARKLYLVEGRGGSN